MLNLFDVYDQQIIKSRKKDIQKEMIISLYIYSTTATYRTMYLPFLNASSDPILSIAPCDIHIDWGDGYTSSILKGNKVTPGTGKIEHGYSNRGIYTVKIYSEDGILPMWKGIQGWNNSQNCLAYVREYQTPLLKILDPGSLTLTKGGNSTYFTDLYYIPTNIFKNNSHITTLTSSLGFANTKEIYPYSCCNFVLDDNILKYLPNLTSISGFNFLLSSKHNYNINEIFKPCPKLENIEIYESLLHIYREDKTFPDIFQYCPELNTLNTSYLYKSTSDTAERIKYIPKNLLRNNPKIYQLRYLMSDLINLETNFGDFDEFFHPEWSPLYNLTMDGFLSCVNVNSTNIGNALGLKEKIDLALERSGNSINLDKGLLYNRTGMEGYSSTPSNWRISPY